MTYPIYIPSLGRAELCTTPQTLLDGGVESFTICVEADEADAYAARFGEDKLAVIDHSRQGLAMTRSWIKRHSEGRGESWHWQLDDDVMYFAMRAAGEKSRRVPALEAMTYAEALTVRFSNLAGVCLSAINYPTTKDFAINQMIYSHKIIRNGTPFYWRSNCVDDIDFSIQLLAGGWCTIAVKLYRAATPSTESMAGGCTEIDYQNDENRLKKVRGLQQNWPYLFDIQRRGGLPRATSGPVWRKFRTRLELADGQS